MEWSFMFFVNSALLGVALAMDAFSVSLANGLNEPYMKKNKQMGIAGTFAGFQFLMPVIGWVCVTTIVKIFNVFEKFVPWIALILLGFIGGKMLVEGIKNKEEAGEESKGLGIGTLIVQGIATSIDALSVGFTIEKYDLVQAFVAALIIAVVTFFICLIGLYLGKKFGTKLAGKANILGGVILIGIGIEIFLTNIL